MEEVADDGKGFSLRDATNLGRYIYPGQARKYFVCFEKEAARLQATDLYAVPATEDCPTRIGATIPVPKVPDLSGSRVQEALEKALIAGYYPNRVNLFKVGAPTKEVSPKPLANWRVCHQEPKVGTTFDASADVKLHVATRCP